MAELLESLTRIVRLQALCGEAFTVRAAAARGGPADPDARTLVRHIAKMRSGDWLGELEWALLQALLRAQALELAGREPGRARGLRAAMERFRRYEELVEAR